MERSLPRHFASVVAASIIALVISLREKRRFGFMVGMYVGYGFEDDRANPLVRKDEPQAIAEVSHRRKNILDIEVTDAGGRHWTGEISMEIETIGTIVWRYDDTTDPEYSVGIKRLAVDKSRGVTQLFTEEVEIGGPVQFGKEMFVMQ